MPALRAKRNLALSRTLRRFSHPHLSHGIAYTPFGAFQVRRGIVEAPEEVGTRCGWVLLEDDGLDDDRSQMERSALGSRPH
jgi:hypothetical protein